MALTANEDDSDGEPSGALPLRRALDDGVTVTLGGAEREPVADTDADEVAVRELDVVALGLCETDGEAVALLLLELVRVRSALTLRDAVPIGEREMADDNDGDALTGALRDVEADGDTERVELLEDDSLALRAAEGENDAHALTDADALVETAALPVPRAVEEGVSEDVAVCVAVAHDERVPVGERDGTAESVDDTVGVCVSVASGDTVATAVVEGEGVGGCVRETDIVTHDDTEDDGERLGASEAVAVIVAVP